ncbi:MAG: response regulator, partial [Myxococcota bacterium]
MPQKPAKARLLVVDDDDDNRRMIARRLEHEGFEVLEAASGGEALRLVEEQHINLMVLDVMMPDMSGLEVLETVRGTAPRADLPVLMATAKTGSDDMVDALRRGANDYVTKPIDFPVLVARINSHLQTRAQASTVPAAATAIPADGRVAPGTMLDGRYEVRRMLGEGAFAIVYEATQLSTGQTVAMKILHTHRALDDDALERERFEREMQTIAHLHHPHIVRLIDYGVLKATLRHVDSGWIETAEGAGFAVDQTSGGGRVLVRRLPYIVMEFVHGRTLQQLIKDEGAFDLGEAVDLMLPVLSAVAEGHRAGVVHRDLKPPNIMVPTSSIGRFDPRVLDFGIAKPQDEDTFMRRDESFFGTPEYMAPEVLSGDGSAGPIADQYALAIILYEMLKGSTARESESYVNLLSTIANEDLKRL